MPTGSTTRTTSPRCWVPRGVGGPAGTSVHRPRTVQGKPAARQGQPRLAARPLQPAQARRRVHPLRHRSATRIDLDSQSFCRLLSRRSRSGRTCSSKTGSTWATWLWSAALRYDLYDSRARRCGRLSPLISTNPAVRSQQPGRRSSADRLAVRRGPEPQLRQPAHPGLLPGDRADQLPAVLLPPGAGPGLRRRSSGHQHRLAITNTNNFYGSDLDFGRTITFEFGVRHAFSDDMVLDVAAYNKDNLSNAAGRLRPGSIRSGAQPEHPGHDQRRLREHPRYRPATRPAVRQPVQRHAVLHLPAGQEHGLRSRHLPRLSARGCSIRSPAAMQPPPQAILPTDFNRPHTLAARARPQLPQRLAAGIDDGDGAPRTWACSPLPLHQRHAVHRWRSGRRRRTIVYISGDDCEQPVSRPLNSSRLPSFKNLDLRFTKGFGIGGNGPDRADVEAGHLAELHQHHPGLHHDQRCPTIPRKSYGADFAADQRRLLRRGRRVGRPALGWFRRSELRWKRPERGPAAVAGQTRPAARQPRTALPHPGRGAVRQRRPRLRPGRTAPGVGPRTTITPSGDFTTSPATHAGCGWGLNELLGGGLAPAGRAILGRPVGTASPFSHPREDAMHSFCVRNGCCSSASALGRWSPRRRRPRPPPEAQARRRCAERIPAVCPVAREPSTVNRIYCGL